jgi:hypothetical protein
MPGNPRSRARAGCWLAVVAMALLGAGCDDDRQPIFSTATDVQADAARKAVQAEIAELAKVKAPNDPDAVVAYHKAKDRLIARGAVIETQLIEALAGSPDWGVRLGVVEVLKALGTRQSVEPLINVLDDPQPLVALNADYLLQGITKHSEIPAAGQPTGANALPPVPRRDPQDLALDADEKLWAAWHGEHRAALKKAWSIWWTANKATIKID